MKTEQVSMNVQQNLVEPKPQLHRVVAPPLQPDHGVPEAREQYVQQVQTAQPTPANSGNSNWQDRVPVGNRSVASKGLIFIFGFLGLFILWAFLFPISSAVVSMGKIVSAGSNKLIQHQSGGVVKQILAHDGETVAKDQVLVILNPSDSQADLGRLTARQSMLLALKARLKSEQGDNVLDNLAGISNAKLRGNKIGALTSNSAPEFDPVIEEQRREFEAGRKRFNSQLDAASAQVEALKDTRTGLRAQLLGQERQLSYTEMELRKMRPLVAEGYLAKNRMWELDRRRLDQVTAIGNLEAEVSSTDQRIAEAESNLTQLSDADQEQRSEELTKVISELAEIRDQLAAAKTAVEATELRAPVAGTLTNMTANTDGGVIAPGSVVAEIVPTNSDLITEFRVAPQSVKSIKLGQKTRVTITAFNQRTYMPIDGEIIYVSADSKKDEQTGEVYFLARAKLMGNPEKQDGLNEIQPGMQTQVFALSEPRVFMDYLFQPIQDSFNKAFRETN